MGVLQKMFSEAEQAVREVIHSIEDGNNTEQPVSSDQDEEYQTRLAMAISLSELEHSASLERLGKQKEEGKSLSL